MIRMRLPLLSCGVILAASLCCVSARAEDDPIEMKRFSELSGDEWVKAHAVEGALHYESWKTAKGKERAREAAIVKFHAWCGERPELIAEIFADGRLAETEVKPPAEVETVKVTVKYEVPEDRGLYDRMGPVWRRLTPSTFEVWTPHEGRLFNKSGEVIATASPTRDNSQGREWFGAFLPDGHWITTELHEGDGRVYIFNRKGKCLHEIKSGTLLKGKPKEMLIVPWARSTRDGAAWLIRIGSEEGLGESLLEPDGTSRTRKEKESLWRLCQPRQLGVRLFTGICWYETESDDGKLLMTSTQPSHGQGVGNPMYEIVGSGLKEDGTDGLGHIPSDGRSFGFWPQSHATHVFVGYEERDARTWFFDDRKRYQGWVAGERVGDDGKAMIFRTRDGRCITVSSAMRATRAQRFQLPDGQLLMPLELHPDIGLGIFAKTMPPESAEDRTPSTSELAGTAKEIIVARWEAAAGGKR